LLSSPIRVRARLLFPPSDPALSVADFNIAILAIYGDVE